VAATIASVRQGDVKMEPGYDGVYGVVAARTV
jgi:PHP family Zn ribbon phosphoesterase